MKELEIIVANRTHRSSDLWCESSVDKAPVSESLGRTGVRASNLAVASSRSCSIVNLPTRIRFKWKTECAEPFGFRRRQHPLLSSGRCSSGTFRRNDDSMITRSVVQSGELPCSGIMHSGMHNANRISRAWNGGSGHSIDDNPDNKGKEGRACGYWLSLGQWKSRLLPARAIQSYAFHPPELREEQMLAPLCWRLSMHQTEKGRVHVMLWRDPSWPDLKPDTRNGSIRNFSGVAGNGPSGNRSDGMSELYQVA